MEKEDFEKLLETNIPAFGMSLREFFGSCLYGLWDDESFGGKRPGQDSDWRYHIIAEMVKIDPNLGKFDQYGELDEWDVGKIDKIYDDLITYALWGE